MTQHHEKKKQSWQSSIFELAYLLLIVFLVRTIGFGLYQVPTGSMETTMLVGERFFADKLSYVFRKPRHGEIIAFNGPEFKYSTYFLMRLFQRYVWGPDNWTKRVIGIPGDTIRGAIENGRPVIYRNGVKLDEPYINKYPLIRLYNQSPRSYDSSVSYEKQPFYDVNQDSVVYDDSNNPELIVPGTPIIPRSGKLSPDETRNNWTRSDVFFIKLGEDEYWCMGDNRLGSHDCRFFGPIKEQEIHGRIVFRIWSIDSNESWWIVDLIKHPFNFWTRVRWSRFFQIMN